MLLDAGFRDEGSKRCEYRIGSEYRDAKLLARLFWPFEAGRESRRENELLVGSRALEKRWNIQIVHAQPEHAAEFLKFDHTVRQETPNLLRTASELPSSLAEYKRRLGGFNGNDCMCWLAVADSGEIAGAATGFLPYGSLAGDDVALWIAVRRKYWRQGIGAELIRALTEWARFRGKHRLTAEVLASNGPALAFYERAGFEMEATRPGAALLDGEYREEIVLGVLI